jgi:hypothetical protein
MTNFPDRIELRLKELEKTSVFNIHLEQKPAGMTFNGKELADSTDFQFDARKSRLIAKIPGGKNGILVVNK